MRNILPSLNISDLMKLSDYIFLILISISILIIGSAIEPGVTPDSLIKYFPVSENIFYSGLNWYFFNGSYETTVVPPLFEVLTASIMLFGLDVIHASGAVSLISFAILPFPLFFLGKIIGGRIMGYSTVLICCSLKMLWDCGTSAMSEMLFILLLFSSMFFFIRYITNFYRSDLIISSLLLICTNWTRWIGIILLFTYLSVLLIQILQKKEKTINAILFLIISLPPILLLYVRNFLLGAEIYSIDKMPFSITNLIINIGMICANLIWDFLGIIPLKTFNQFLMEIYFSYLTNKYSIDYLSLFSSLQLIHFNSIALICTFILVILFFIIIIIDQWDRCKSVSKSIYTVFIWVQLFIIFIIYYLLVLLYTESTTKLSLIDSRYLTPLYPFFILIGVKLFFIWEKKTIVLKTIRGLLTIFLVISIVIMQLSSTIIFLSNYQHGRGFSDPDLMEGPAYQWLITHWDHESPIIINDGLRTSFLNNIFLNHVEKMPLRGSSIQEFLDHQSSGTYIVITPVIETKGPYRWNELELIMNSSPKIQLLLNKDDDMIFRVL